jgi:hypothetical protein
VFSRDRAVIEADVRLVLDVPPEPLVARVPVVLAPKETRAVSTEFAGVVLDPGQTFGRCEIALAGAQVACWVRNRGAHEARFGLRARLVDGGDPPPEQAGSFTLHPGESRPIPFAFDRPGRVGTCVIE